MGILHIKLHDFKFDICFLHIDAYYLSICFDVIPVNIICEV